MDKQSPTINQLIAMWDIQDSLLQSYRNIFLTSQSIIFAISVIIASGPKPFWAFLLFFIGVFMIFYLWIPICQRRGYDVWFFHLNLLYYEEGKVVIVEDDATNSKHKNRIKIFPINTENINIFRSFKNWQEMNIMERKDFLKNDKNGKLLVRSKVRTKMEKHLPWAFVVLWGILGLFIIIRVF